MCSKDKIPNWRQYEWLIAKIYHDSNIALNTKVLNHTKLRGQYSEIPREIDILVETDKFKTIIECKNYSRPIDIKNVESFLSMFSDVDGDFGIIISSSGFTNSVYKRIREFEGKITLEQIDWESAYTSSFQKESYGRITDLCSNCLAEFESGKEVPGLLCWEPTFGIEINGKLSLFLVAKCLKCEQLTIYCDSCGWITLSNDEDCCELRNEFIHHYLASN